MNRLARKDCCPSAGDAEVEYTEVGVVKDEEENFVNHLLRCMDSTRNIFYS